MRLIELQKLDAGTKRLIRLSEDAVVCSTDQGIIQIRLEKSDSLRLDLMIPGAEVLDVQEAHGNLLGFDWVAGKMFLRGPELSLQWTTDIPHKDSVINPMVLQMVQHAGETVFVTNFADQSTLCSPGWEHYYGCVFVDNGQNLLIAGESGGGVHILKHEIPSDFLTRAEYYGQNTREWQEHFDETHEEPLWVGSSSRISGMSFYEDASRLAIAHDTIEVLSVRDRGGSKIYALDADGNRCGQMEVDYWHSQPFNWCAPTFSADGRLLCCGNKAGRLFVFEASTGEKIATSDHEGRAAILSVAVLKNHRIVTLHSDGALVLWRLG